MKPRISVLTFCTLLLAIAVVLFVRGRRASPEPEFGGRSLSSWLPDLYFLEAPGTRSNAVYALQQMGTAALPFLVELTTSKTAVLKWKVASEVQKRVPRRLELAERWAMPDYRQALGVEGLRALGTAATPAIPALASALTNQPFPGSAAEGLAAIGRPSVPALIAALDCTNDQQKLAAVGAFQKLGPAAKEALPDLQRLYHRGTGVWYASAITNALYRIDPLEAARLLKEP